ncbi:hypothetical protein TBLA_0A02820 [Henningerozyma blattae CBS 6284]|uniref:FHA domain-containing protein n=1 Tax=Henningerozyma blattae (strain ATCC 34711 / CBS 6284 / DSM 70876 / NBRC 10599 / NRRL Y-10934 / UCD 77-7) TaxID=1071380 RepID=I2GVC8_HENB6|nr:hypothetical protein TBLA_0A02820 [Tetrapisispora blattae CBS 6284]CCH58080.1 hypothetical protein TBLA_0A02820 [Tetrapisispora blattae CBS 6284]
MWIISYSYKSADDTLTNVSCCLKQNETYSIGRSKKSPLFVKNDKSISRQHVTFHWTGNLNNQLSLLNQGKLTRVNSRILNPAETLLFNADIEHPAEVELGATPVVVCGAWTNHVYNIPIEFQQFESQLKDYGFNINFGPQKNEAITYVIDIEPRPMNNNFISGTLYYSLVNKSIILKSSFLTSLLNLLNPNVTTFNIDFQNLLDASKIEDFRNINLESLKVELTGIKLIVLNDNTTDLIYFIAAMEVINLPTITTEDDTIFINTVKSHSEERLILLTTSNSRHIETIKVHTFKDFYQGIKNQNINHLIQVIKKDSPHTIERNSRETISLNNENQTYSQLSPYIEDNNKVNSNTISDSLLKQTSELIKPSVNDHAPEKPPVKRRRLNRKRVQPLDSLHFFVGGNTNPTQNNLSQTESDLKNVANPRNVFSQRKSNDKIDKDEIIVSQPYTKEPFLKEDLSIPTSITKQMSLSNNETLQYPSNSQHSPVSLQEPICSNIGSNIPSIGKEDTNPSLVTNKIMAASTSKKDVKILAARSKKPLNDSIDMDMSDQAELTDIHSAATDQQYEKKTLSNYILNNKPDDQANSLKRSKEQEKGTVSPVKRSPTPNNFISALQDAKNRETDRLGSKFVKIYDEELTEEAINKFSNLAVVETNVDIVISEGKKNNESITDIDPKWKGRKNFKNFVKQLPKYRMKTMPSGDNGVASFIRNSAFLLAREYVPMQEFKMNNQGNRIQEFPEFPVEYSPQQAEQLPSNGASMNTITQTFSSDDLETLEQSFSFSRASGGDINNNVYPHITKTTKGNSLFVTEDDDDDATISQNFDTETSPDHNLVANLARNMVSIDDTHPNISIDQNNDLGIEISMSGNDDNHIRSTSSNMNSLNRNHSTKLHNSRSLPSNNSRQSFRVMEGSEDDDDDAPKFKFSRKR